MSTVTPEELANVSTMTPAELLTRADFAILTEDKLQVLLGQCAKLADHPALALLLTVLAEDPLEIAALRADQLEALADQLHPDTDGPVLARAAARMLAQWAEEGDGLAPEHMGGEEAGLVVAAPVLETAETVHVSSDGVTFICGGERAMADGRWMGRDVDVFRAASDRCPLCESKLREEGR